MFKLFSTKQADVAIREVATERPHHVSTIQEKIEEIHHAFNTEGDRLLAQAKAVLEKNVLPEDKVALAERLRKMGFISNPLIEQVKVVEDEKRLSEEVAKRIEHYNFYYPQNRFIDEASILRLCEKYDLHFGLVSDYTGDVPVGNLSDIENFKVREEDMEYMYILSGFRMSQRIIVSHEDFKQQQAYLKEREAATGNSMPYASGGFYSSDIVSNVALSICAPLKDFNLTDRRILGRKIVNIPDPIVLHPVSGGYLIVTAWGLEAKDEAVVNSNKN